MARFSYEPLQPGPDSIRLLRLIPNENFTGPIQCELIDYSLEGSTQHYSFEALSYVWGDWTDAESILVNNQPLPVTANLHAALLHLRDSHKRRLLWVDAISINQEDFKERGHQVKFMAKIHEKASGVIVWLGPATDGSDRAFRKIAQAANDLYDQPDLASQIDIGSLLKRPWFRRIWVLQEVAAAQQILITCGSSEMVGHKFCLGLSSMPFLHEGHLHRLVKPVLNLIRGANWHDRNGIRTRTLRPLGELIDSYSLHESTERHDKIYALLGMSSDDTNAAGLVPDYEVPWPTLFERLVKFILHENVSVSIWSDRELAVVESNGCLLGRITLVSRDRHLVDKVHVWVEPIHSIHMTTCPDREPRRTAHWTLRTVLKAILEDDLVCLVQGASKPTIIRPYWDYFEIVMMTVTPLDEELEDEETIPPKSPFERPEFCRLAVDFPHKLVLAWSWAHEREAKYQSLVGPDSPGQENLDDEREAQFVTLTRLWNMCLVFEYVKEYEAAITRLEELRSDWAKTFGRKHPSTRKIKDKIIQLRKSWYFSEGARFLCS